MWTYHILEYIVQQPRAVGLFQYWIIHFNGQRINGILLLQGQGCKVAIFFTDFVKL